MATPDQLIVSSFSSEPEADAARAVLQALAAGQGLRELKNIATVGKDADGVVTFWETLQQQEYRVDSSLGQALGWLLGAAGMVIGAPLGPVYGSTLGQEAGTDRAAHRDVGFGNEALRQLGASLHAGETALAMLVHAEHAPLVVAELTRLGGTPMQGTLPEATLARLADRAGNG